MAEQLIRAFGDRLGFSVGGLPIEVEVASLRSLDWESMKFNFFFIFEPGSLDDFSATYITSAYLPSDKKPLINQLLRHYPDRKSTRLNSSHVAISYAVFCLEKKT